MLTTEKYNLKANTESATDIRVVTEDGKSVSKYYRKSL
jgi:hypothetical protein